MSAQTDSNVLLSVRDLTKEFSKGKDTLKALNQVSIDVYKGETLGIVGESGCGKSTLGRTALRLYEPTSGNIIFNGKDISSLTSKELKPLRKHIQMIFQDPYASLNPRMTVSEIISEALQIHNLFNRKEERKKRVLELLELVGLHPDHYNRYPHEFSGGQRQRIGIARALAVEPEFIICDEPISALDVSIQAQIINLLEELQEKLGLTYLFIAHDLAIVRHISDRIAVMYLGNVVEIADSKKLYEEPLHPYTEMLLSAIPTPDPKKEKRKTRTLVKGDLPSPINLPKGCPFASRCPKVMPECHESNPKLEQSKQNHFVACHLYT